MPEHITKNLTYCTFAILLIGLIWSLISQNPHNRNIFLYGSLFNWVILGLYSFYRQSEDKKLQKNKRDNPSTDQLSLEKLLTYEEEKLEQLLNRKDSQQP